MKRFIIIATLIITLMMNLIVPMFSAHAEGIDEMAGTPASYVQIIDVKDALENADNAFVQSANQQQYYGEGIVNVVGGSAKTVGNLVRFFAVDAVETVQCLICNGDYDVKYFSWSDATLKDYEAAKKQVCDNLDQAGQEIVNAAKVVKNGACYVGGKIADGVSWVWNGIKSWF